MLYSNPIPHFIHLVLLIKILTPLIVIYFGTNDPRSNQCAREDTLNQISIKLSIIFNHFLFLQGLNSDVFSKHFHRKIAALRVLNKPQSKFSVFKRLIKRKEIGPLTMANLCLFSRYLMTKCPRNLGLGKANSR